MIVPINWQFLGIQLHAQFSLRFNGEMTIKATIVVVVLRGIKSRVCQVNYDAIGPEIHGQLQCLGDKLDGKHGFPCRFGCFSTEHPSISTAAVSLFGSYWQVLLAAAELETVARPQEKSPQKTPWNGGLFNQQKWMLELIFHQQNMVKGHIFQLMAFVTWSGAWKVKAAKRCCL